MQMKEHTTILLFLICSSISGQTFDDFRENSVNKISLVDTISVLKVLGTEIRNRDVDRDEVYVSNYDNSQMLVMIFHPGDALNEFRQFKVLYNSNQIKPPYKIDNTFFETGKGIKLGIHKRQLRIILGKPSRIIKEKGTEIWRYEADENLYFGRYDFKDGHLIQFWFGEAYP
jgi:hypothetical protein